MKIEYAIYERRSGPGPAFLCRPLVDEKERLIFTGATADEAAGAALAWIEKNIQPRPSKLKQEAAVEADIFG